MSAALADGSRRRGVAAALLAWLWPSAVHDEPYGRRHGLLATLFGWAWPSGLDRGLRRWWHVSWLWSWTWPGHVLGPDGEVCALAPWHPALRPEICPGEPWRHKLRRNGPLLFMMFGATAIAAPTLMDGNGVLDGGRINLFRTDGANAQGPSTGGGAGSDPSTDGPNGGGGSGGGDGAQGPAGLGGPSPSDNGGGAGGGDPTVGGGDPAPDGGTTLVSFDPSGDFDPGLALGGGGGGGVGGGGVGGGGGGIGGGAGGGGTGGGGVGGGEPFTPPGPTGPLPPTGPSIEPTVPGPGGNPDPGPRVGPGPIIIVDTGDDGERQTCDVPGFPPCTSTGTGPGGPSGSQTAVPEPATWAMMILGFGAVGYAVRRRRFAFGVR